MKRLLCVVALAGVAAAGAWPREAELYSLSNLIDFEEIPITAEDQETGKEVLYQAYAEKAKAESKIPAPRDKYLAAFWGNWGLGWAVTGLPDYVFIDLFEYHVIALYKPASGDAAAPQHEVLIKMGLVPAEFYTQPIMADKKFLAQLAEILNSNPTFQSREGIPKTAPLIAYIFHWYYAYGGILYWRANPVLVSLAEDPESFLTELQGVTEGTYMLLDTLPKGGVYTDASIPDAVVYTFYTMGGVPRVLRQWFVAYVPEEGFNVKEVLIGECR